ncbi:hypothetical protein ScPMuIL_017793 [Solemya velum]
MLRGGTGINRRMPVEGPYYRLENDDPADYSYGIVSAYRYGNWGRICTTFWDNNDAEVLCRQLGFAGGYAMQYRRSSGLPYVISEINCDGSEESLDDCDSEIQICYDEISVGAVCYENSGVHLELIDGASHYGRVVRPRMSVDGVSGTICNSTWTEQEATVVCRQLGFFSGLPISRDESLSEGPVWVADVECMGDEDTIFQCISGGWKNVTNTDCLAHKADAAVYCFRQVRISGGRENDNFIMGRVEIHNDFFWNTLCSVGFDQIDAEVVCKELGFSKAVILAPHSFGLPEFYTYIRDMDCSAEQTSITECDSSHGSCAGANYASLLCLQDHYEENMLVSFDGDHGQVEVSLYGVEGTVCREGWDDTDAAVVCKRKGFAGDELGLVDCKFDEAASVSAACTEDMVPAGVICYNTTGMAVRLVPLSPHKPFEGQIEVSRDGVWGTICSNSWSHYDAVVVCRELGYASGQITSQTSGSADAPVYLDRVGCDGTESSIFECPSLSWGVPCDENKRDVAVQCNRWVQTHYLYYGPVQVWDRERNNYQLVCSQGFDENSANVVCKEMGFKSGVSICCSAFGDFSYHGYTLTDVSCVGSENSILNCTHQRMKSCDSDRYASVVCSDLAIAPNLPSGVGIKHYRWGNVILKHFGHDGLGCSEGFDDKDATVICRDRGYVGGFAYKLSTTDLSTHEHEIRWLSNIDCDGTETSFRDCSNLNWGEIGDCSRDSVAAVYCYSNPVFSDIQLRIQGAQQEETTGYVEMQVSGQWGTICGKNFTRKEAAVVCHQLGFQDGVAMAAGSSSNKGPVWIGQAVCTGSETSIMDCILTGFPNVTADCYHTADAAVHCFDTVRITGSENPYFGRLEVFEQSQWQAVCMESFTDTEAKVACKQMGNKDGRAVCCSALGDLPDQTVISADSVRCQGHEESMADCSHSATTCDSGLYVSVYCSEADIAAEDIDIRLPDNSFFGPLEVRRNGLWGYLCDGPDWSDVNAGVVCKELGYGLGRAVHSFMDRDVPITVSALKCTGAETAIADCSISDFVNYTCGDFDTVAGVLCSDSEVKFDISDKKLATIAVSSGSLTMSFNDFEEAEATAFCRDADCKALWDPTKTDKQITAGVICNHEVRLSGGDDESYGAVEVYAFSKWGRVCSSGFDDVDAGTVCRRLDYEKGVALCCYPFGYMGAFQSYNNVDCQGDEELFTDCPHDEPPPGGAQFCESLHDYASVVCYDGEMGDDYSLGLSLAGSYTGDVVLTYLGVPGRICSDGWSDADAFVVCREMGFPNGTAYHHYLPDPMGLGISGPLWTSLVDCSGNEERLVDCAHTTFGTVSSCDSGHYAGVLCYGKTALYYKLTAGDDRYGRVEVSINGGWMSMCDTFWDARESHVFCRQLGYKTGDPYYGEYLFQGTGPVWDSRIYCEGEEPDLNACPHTGWKQTTSSRCAFHKHDAGAFCYINVKLHTGIGRTTDRGAVLYYGDDNEWYTVCDQGFTEASAQVVCRELGFIGGYPVCCSSHGTVGHSLLPNKTVRCDGTETQVSQCLKEEYCDTQTYAAVICQRYPYTITGSRSTSSTAIPSATQQSDNKDTIIIVVTVIAAIFFLLLIILLVVVVRRKSKRRIPSDGYVNPIISADETLNIQNGHAHYTVHPNEPPPAYDNPIYPLPANGFVLPSTPPYEQASASSPDYDNIKSPDLDSDYTQVEMPEGRKDHTYDNRAAAGSNSDYTSLKHMTEEGEKQQLSGMFVTPGERDSFVYEPPSSPIDVAAGSCDGTTASTSAGLNSDPSRNSNGNPDISTEEDARGLKKHVTKLNI